MTPKQTNVAQRFVACDGWRWMPGMLARSANNTHGPARIESLDGDTYGLTVVPGTDGPVFVSPHEWGVAGAFPRGDTIPDITDSATMGCIVALVREAWGCDEWRRLTVEPAGAGWCVVLRNGRHRPPSRARPGWDLDKHAHRFWPGFHGPLAVMECATEAELLLAALEAAHG